MNRHALKRFDFVSKPNQISIELAERVHARALHRSAIDATAVVASNCSVVHLEQKLYIGCSSCLDVVCGFADERGELVIAA